MEFDEVASTLNDVPFTFKRKNQTFLQFMDALTSALARMTQAADGATSQLVFAEAAAGWLDLWGLLLGTPRLLNEADSHYYNRLIVTFRGGAGPVQVMYDWLFAAWGINVVITENLPEVGYQLLFPASVSPVQITQICIGLKQVRPAGIPFSTAIANVGTYLDTINYFNASRVTGQYLGGGSTPIYVTLPVTTNNSPPLVPQLFLTDPTLNPSLSPPDAG